MRRLSGLSVLLFAEFACAAMPFALPQANAPRRGGSFLNRGSIHECVTHTSNQICVTNRTHTQILGLGNEYKEYVINPTQAPPQANSSNSPNTLGAALGVFVFLGAALCYLNPRQTNRRLNDNHDSLQRGIIANAFANAVTVSPVRMPGQEEPDPTLFALRITPLDSQPSQVIIPVSGSEPLYRRTSQPQSSISTNEGLAISSPSTRSINLSAQRQAENTSGQPLPAGDSPVVVSLRPQTQLDPPPLIRSPSAVDASLGFAPQL